MTDFARSITIDIQDASGTSLTLNYGTLSSGNWETQPVPGSTIKPGDSSTFVNGATNNFASLGGTIFLTPASGGTITIGWSWPNGSPVTSTVPTTALSDIAVTHSLTNTNSDFPRLTVMVTNPKTLAEFASAQMKEVTAR
jgi:hypothetical protein